MLKKILLSVIMGTGIVLNANAIAYAKDTNTVNIQEEAKQNDTVKELAQDAVDTVEGKYNVYVKSIETLNANRKGTKAEFKLITVDDDVYKVRIEYRYLFGVHVTSDVTVVR